MADPAAPNPAQPATTNPEKPRGKNPRAGKQRLVSSGAVGVVDHAAVILRRAGADVDAFTDAAKQCTPKQLRLAVAYARGLTLIEAYAEAGYARGNLGKWRETAASACLRLPYVAVVLKGLERAAAMRHEVSLDRVTAELVRVGFSDLDHYSVQPDGNVAVKDSAPLDATKALSSLEVERITLGDGVLKTTTKVKLHNKVAALTKLADMLRPLAIESDGAGGVAIPGHGRGGTIEIHIHGGELGMIRQPAAIEVAQPIAAKTVTERQRERKALQAASEPVIELGGTAQ